MDKPVFKIKHCIIILLIGYIVLILGFLGKINSEPWGRKFMTIGILIQVVAIILAIIKFIIMKDLKDFINK